MVRCFHTELGVGPLTPPKDAEGDAVTHSWDHSPPREQSQVAVADKSSPKPTSRGAPVAGGSSPAQGAPPTAAPQNHDPQATLKTSKKPTGPRGATSREGPWGEEEKEEPNNSGDSNPRGHPAGRPAGSYRYIYIYIGTPGCGYSTRGWCAISKYGTLKIFSFFFVVVLFCFSIAKLIFFPFQIVKSLC